jgi:phosphatidylethanolamine-binding protein (PEBP) family uncharacterized protein
MMLVYEGSLHAQMSRFAADVTWAGSKSCFDPQSPPFTLNGVPPGTRRLHFAMKDLDAPDFRHGGGTVAYDGQRLVPRGAFSYRGPCPPQGQHHYQWTVEAVDAAATRLRPFPSPKSSLPSDGSQKDRWEYADPTSPLRHGNCGEAINLTN